MFSFCCPQIAWEWRDGRQPSMRHMKTWGTYTTTSLAMITNSAWFSGYDGALSLAKAAQTRVQFPARKLFASTLDARHNFALYLPNSTGGKCAKWHTMCAIDQSVVYPDFDSS